MEKNVLTKEEREYFRKLFFAFADCVVCISRETLSDTHEELQAVLQFDDLDDYAVASSPKFEKGTRFSGMVLGRKYTPSELGITLLN